MKAFPFGRTTSILGFAALLLAGCGGSSVGSPVSPTPQNRARVALVSGSRSWMRADTVKHDLLYVSHGTAVNVYTYKKGKLLGSLAPFEDVWGECANKNGNVFIVDYYYGAYEYSHGGTAPIASLYNPGGRSIGCSIDPTSGDLAVSGGGGSKDAIVTIFKYNKRLGWRYAKLYSDNKFALPYFCGYDSKGDLFVDGLAVGSGNFTLAELPKGKTAFVNIRLNQSIAKPGNVQWDGTQMTIGDWGSSPSVVYQFVVSGKAATVTGSTLLGDSSSTPDYWIQGDTLVAGDYAGNDFGFWRYPQGGTPLSTSALRYAKAVVVSLK